jgi:hypothetical protein
MGRTEPVGSTTRTEAKRQAIELVEWHAGMNKKSTRAPERSSPVVLIQEEDPRVLWKLATRSKQLSLQECSESQQSIDSGSTRQDRLSEEGPVGGTTSARGTSYSRRGMNQESVAA